MGKVTLSWVATALREARDRRGASVLIGAGCSVTAAIPTADGLVVEIKRRYPYLDDGVSLTYGQLMAQLSEGERHELIASYVDSAKLNWAHIALAQLIKAGYITRVLTTNFDPLVVRACALVGVYPAIYDLASSSNFDPAKVSEPCVFYLHGQRSGFVMLNTEDECTRHFAALAPVFDDAGERRPWLVIGYSGDNDPVFEHLAQVKSFAFRLFWVGFKNNPPPPHVQMRLLQTPSRYAHFLAGHTADTFFVNLARELGCFPPDLIEKPFSHLSGLLDNLVPFTLDDTEVDILESAQKRIRRAIDTFETGEAPTFITDEALSAEALEASAMLLKGRYDFVIREYSEAAKDSEELSEIVSWAHYSLGNRAYQKGNYANAHDEYSAALAFQQDSVDILNSLGDTLLAMAAQAEKNDDAERLLREAITWLQKAVNIEPTDVDARYNFATAMGELAKRLPADEEREATFRIAVANFELAHSLSPENPDILTNWGVTLVDRSRSVSSPEARKALLDAAEEKFIAVNELEPGSSAYNLAGVAALRGDFPLCKERLEISRLNGTAPKATSVLRDEDFATVRDTDWFKDFVGTLSN